MTPPNRRDAGRVARGGAWLFLVTLLASGAAFFTSIFLARALGPETFGPYNTAYFLTSCLGVVAAAGFPIVLTREVAALRSRGDAPAAAARSLEAERAARRHAALAIVLVVAASLLLLERRAGPELGIAFLLLSGTILPLAISTVRRADLTGREAYRDIATSTAVAAPLGLVLTVIAVSMGFGIVGAGLSAVVSATLLTVLFGKARSRRAESALEPRALAAPSDPAFGRAARRCLAIQAIDFVVWQRSELLFLMLLLPGSAEAGYYGAAFSLTTASMSLVPGALAGALLPALSAIHASGDAVAIRRSYVRAIRGLALLTFPIVAGGLVLARPIVACTLGPAYAGTTALPFAITLVGGAFAALGAASSGVLYATKGEGLILKMGLGLAALNILLDVILIPAHGAVGAAVANTTTQVLAVTLGTAWVARQIIRAFPGIGEIARIAAAALGMAAAVYAMGDPGTSLGALIVRVAVGAATYAVLVFLMGALDPADKAIAGEIFRKVVPTRAPRRQPPREEGARRGPRPPAPTRETDPPVGMPTA